MGLAIRKLHAKGFRHALLFRRSRIKLVLLSVVWMASVAMLLGNDDG